MKNETKRIVKRPALRYQVAIVKNVTDEEGNQYAEWYEHGNVAYVWDKAVKAYYTLHDALVDAGLMDVTAGIVDEQRCYTSAKPIVR